MPVNISCSRTDQGASADEAAARHVGADRAGASRAVDVQVPADAGRGGDPQTNKRTDGGRASANRAGALLADALRPAAGPVAACPTRGLSLSELRINEEPLGEPRRYGIGSEWIFRSE